ncbi:OmpA family protein [Arthrobacter sp. MYb227]|uniref:OmpA family protein n=1 Tax=Arthrobacter sp. MYb227 TaxID=1848601 RepID=UPI0015E39E46|nr:OmpA family protein [Arthrobacter sp. MYb227]
MNRRTIAVVGLSVVLGLQFAPAHAEFSSPNDLPEPTTAQLAKSVRVWDPEKSVGTWDPSDSVKSVEQVNSKAGKTTISLAADVLFEQDSSKMPASASAKLEKLVAQVPQGATVNVDGHTDSVKGKVDNRVLSTGRAKAVAKAIEKSRPDLELVVKGHAALQPTVREDPKDLDTFAANRRVEISYKS